MGRQTQRINASECQGLILEQAKHIYRHLLVTVGMESLRNDGFILIILSQNTSSFPGWSFLSSVPRVVSEHKEGL